MNVVHNIYYGVRMKEYIRESLFDDVPDKRQMEIDIEAAQLAIARLRETPYQHSIEHKVERLNQLLREYAEAFGEREYAISFGVG